jgi:hypothetical protein|tara:strand:+ start:1255 stop:1419 length:165 start_codon:yes stop_codon:yes gene_type:complete
MKKMLLKVVVMINIVECILCSIIGEQAVAAVFGMVALLAIIELTDMYLKDQNKK